MKWWRVWYKSDYDNWNYDRDDRPTIRVQAGSRTAAKEQASQELGAAGRTGVKIKYAWMTYGN